MGLAERQNATGATSQPDIIPVTLLTGFLGSGKSTLLSEILRHSEFQNTAVIVNEFGEVGLDGVLIEHSENQIIEMTSGCLCCTVRGDIRQTLLMLYSKRESGEIPQFERVVVESTGLADPAPVIHTLMSDRFLERRFMLGGVVTTVDSANGFATIEKHKECEKQVAVADRIVITKTDIKNIEISKEGIDGLWTKLSWLNPTAQIWDRHDGSFKFGNLFDTSLYDPGNKTIDVLKWLNAEVSPAEDDHHHHHHMEDEIATEQNGGHHQHDVTRHGQNIRSFTLVLDQPVKIDTFATALEALLFTQASRLLRIKGIVNTVDRPGKPMVIHGVQHIFHDPIWLDDWPDGDHRTKLVFITDGIERATLDEFFKSWISSSVGHWL